MTILKESTQKVQTMRHQPSRYDLKAFHEALKQAQSQPSFSPAYLAELARKRDQYLLSLAS